MQQTREASRRTLGATSEAQHTNSKTSVHGRSKDEKSQQRASRQAIDISDDLCHIQEALQPVRGDWYQIGVQLYIDSHILDNIKENNGELGFGTVSFSDDQRMADRS